MPELTSPHSFVEIHEALSRRFYQSKNRLNKTSLVDLIWRMQILQTSPCKERIYPTCKYLAREGNILTLGMAGAVGPRPSCTVNPALLTSSFVWLIQLCLLHISLFKVIIRKYFSQGEYELMNFLFVLLDKLKIFTL
jgi:hypothetical protein